MSADLLREAAALMRERAEAATPGPWFPWDGWGPTSDGLMGFSRLGPHSGERVLHHEEMRDIFATRADVEHIASWHPSVALAVADLLDAEADTLAALERTWQDVFSKPYEGSAHPTAVKLFAFVRAYLGRES